MNTIRNNSARRQRGVSTLLIAMLLLAILTIITIFAARYGVNEQRTSGNEYRYKMAFQVAEAGLHQSVEYIKLNTTDMLSTVSGGWLFPGNSLWQPCTDALPGGMTVDPCLAQSDSSGMYRYVGATNGILPVSGIMPKLEGTAGTDKVGEFPASYDSYAALCRLDLTIPTAPHCALSPSTGDAFYVTVVSRGTLDDEGATATVKQSFGTFHLLGGTPAVPLIAAASTIGLGNAQIVPNPDAGGFGVPLSIWSKGDAQVDGASFATCQLGEWLDNAGNPAPTAEDLLNGVCESCTCNGLCPGYGLLSGNAQACAEAKDKLEGEDILDIDSNSSDAVPKVVDSKYFPDDLFAYVFGVASGAPEQMYLDTYATKITDCAQLGPTNGGLYWYTGSGCSLGDVGSLRRPVILVSDAVVTINANSQFYGIIFVRQEAGTGELLKATGGPQVYGSVVLEGGAKMAGNPTIVYNKAVLANIRNSPDFVRYGPIPGTWSDTLQ